MSAREDYPLLASYPNIGGYGQAGLALDEIDRLRVDAALAGRVRRCAYVPQERTSADYDPDVFVELDGIEYESADELLDAIVGDAGIVKELSTPPPPFDPRPT